MYQVVLTFIDGGGVDVKKYRRFFLKFAAFLENLKFNFSSVHALNLT